MNSLRFQFYLISYNMNFNNKRSNKLYQINEKKGKIQKTNYNKL